MKFYVVLSKEECTKFCYNRIKNEYQDDFSPECIFNEAQLLIFKRTKYNENRDDIILWRNAESASTIRRFSIRHWKSFSDYDTIMAEIIFEMASACGARGSFSIKIPVKKECDFSKKMTNDDIKNLYTAIAYNLKEDGYIVTFEHGGSQESSILKYLIVSW